MISMLQAIAKSLNIKLVLLLLFVSLTSLLIVALLSRSLTLDAFEQYVFENQAQDFKETVTAFYEEHGSWDGVRDVLPERPLVPPQPTSSRPLGASPLRPLQGSSLNSSASSSSLSDSSTQGLFPEPRPPRPPPPFSGRPPPPPLPPPPLFALADSSGKIVISAEPRYTLNEVATRSQLNNAVPVSLNGQRIGSILLNTNSPQPNQQIIAFRNSLNRSLLISALSAFLLALAIGIFFTQTLTRPIRDMIQATSLLAKGEHRVVPVRSQDELGELSTTFNKMSSDLEQAAQSRKQMTADIAHELRTPLTSLAWYVEAFQTGAIEANEEEFGIMHGQIIDLQRLVEDLRILSLADAGELKLLKEPVRAKMLLADISQSYKLRAESVGVVVEVEAQDELPSLTIDRTRFSQVIGNLVSNALRYTTEGDKIVLSARQQDETLEIAVQDTGEGISPEKLPHIFERFYRADEARAHHPPQQNQQHESTQSGLGLAIAKAIVEAHGGNIHADSQLGQGTSFKISLPI